MVDLILEGFRRFMGRNPRYDMVKTGGVVELLNENKNEGDFVVVSKPVYVEKLMDLRAVPYRHARNKSFFDEKFREIMLKDAADSLKFNVAPFVDSVVISPFSIVNTSIRRNQDRGFIVYRLGVQFLSKGFEGSSSFLEDGVFSKDRAFGYDLETGVNFNIKKDPFGKDVQVRIYESRPSGDEVRFEGKANWSYELVQGVFRARLEEQVKVDAKNISKAYGEIQAVKLSPMRAGRNYSRTPRGQRGFCVAVSYLF